MPGSRGCVPLDCMEQTSRTSHPPDNLIPDVVTAVNLFEGHGGNLTRISEFGVDPLAFNIDFFQQREITFQQNSPSPQEVFSSVVHGKTDLLRHCLVTFFDINLQFSGRL